MNNYRINRIILNNQYDNISLYFIWKSNTRDNECVHELIRYLFKTSHTQLSYVHPMTYMGHTPAIMNVSMSPEGL